jgi:Zn-dependent protease
MIQSSYEIARPFGIPIRLDMSLIILLFFFVSGESSPLYGLAAGLALLLAITLHELGHSLVAMAFGCRVRDITLMMMGGCATLLNMPRKAWQEFLVAAAGPAVSLALGISGFWMVRHISLPHPVAEFIYNQIGWLNIVLGIFNLLPAFPMDGGRILRAILQQFFMSRVKATWIAARVGQFVALLMALSVGYSFLSGRAHGFMLIRLLIAYTIYRAAGREYQSVLAESRQNGPFDGFNGPPGDEVRISPPPYRSGREWTDIKRL